MWFCQKCLIGFRNGDKSVNVIEKYILKNNN